MKQKKVYYAKTLFSGQVIQKNSAILYVGIPGGMNYESKSNFSKEKNFPVIYDGKKMIIANWHKAEAFRKFDDFNGRGTYTLAYFQWKPIVEEEPVSAFNALSKLAGTPDWEDLREKFHPKR